MLTTKPGDKYQSIQRPRVYRALRKRGYSKEAAARISNAQAPGHTVKVSTAVPAVIPPTGSNALFNQTGIESRRARLRKRKVALKATPTRVLDAGNTGVMIALLPSQKTASQIAALSGVTEPIEQLHLTLCFLGDSTEAPLKTNKDRLCDGFLGWAKQHRSVLKGTINGQGRFYHSEKDDTNAVYLAPDLPTLPALRGALTQWIEQAGFDYSQEHGFTPHITVAYVPKDKPTPPIRVDMPAVFDKLLLAWGDEQYEVGLTDSQTAVLKAPNYGARAGQVIAGGLSRANDGKFTGTGGGGGTTEAKPEKPTSGKPAKAPKKTPEQRNAEREAKLAARAAERAAARDAAYRKLNIAPDGQAALEKLRTGDMADTEAIQRAGLEDAGLVERDSSGVYHLTASGRATVNAASRGDAGRAGDTIASARDRLRARRERQATAARKRQDRLDKLAGKAFTVFKDAAGHDRWLAVSSTAYRDRDGEIVSRKALQQAVATGDSTGQRGPLRFWHVPGLDIGSCDYQATAHDGRFLIESGTFVHPAYAAAVKANGEGYQVSIGFLHPETQPDPSGVFHDIAIFERSIVPPGRAANQFTQIRTKEQRMLSMEKLTALKALLGETPELAALLTQVQTTDKDAQERGTAYKDTTSGTTTTVTAAMPILPAEITIGGIIYAVKAFPPAAVEEEKAPPEEMVEAATEVMEEPVDDGPLLTDPDLDAIAERVFARIAPLLDMEKKMRGYMDEMKAVMGGVVAQKDAAVSEQGAALAATQKQLVEVTARLKELEGDQSAGGYRASQRAESALLAQAMKDAGQLPGLAAVGATQSTNGLSKDEQDAYKLMFGDT